MKTLKERLTYAMEISGVKQIDLAKSAGVSRASVNDWVSGKSQNIRGDNLMKIARLLNVNPNWLATGYGKIDSKWPFKKITPEDFDLLPEEAISVFEDLIILQVEKYKAKDDKKAS